jgi:predicted esterase
LGRFLDEDRMVRRVSGSQASLRRAPRIAVLLVALHFGHPASAADAIVSGHFTSSGAKRSYASYVPPGAQSHPLLILLHGSGGTGRKMVERWKGLAEREGIVLAAPDATDRSRWQPPQDGPGLLRDLVEAVKPSHIDARRIYLFGYSAGAVFALYMAPLESEYFAAAAAHAGAYRGEADLGFLGRARRKIPLFLSVGARDAVFPPTVFRSTVQLLEQAGFPVTTEVLPDSAHGYAPSTEINERAWVFLRQHSLPTDPVFIPIPQFSRLTAAAPASPPR